MIEKKYLLRRISQKIVLSFTFRLRFIIYVSLIQQLTKTTIQNERKIRHKNKTVYVKRFD